MYLIFVDSDVVISSLISNAGAAHLLLYQKNITPYISTYSLKEIKIVAKRLGLEDDKLQELIENRFKMIKLKESIKSIKEQFREYTSDSNDTHIIAGAVEAKIKFLISYNIRHFGVERIKRDFDIKITTPGSFLQYLRSQ